MRNYIDTAHLKLQKEQNQLAITKQTTSVNKINNKRILVFRVPPPQRPRVHFNYLTNDATDSGNRILLTSIFRG